MWALLTEDLLQYIVAVGGVETLAYLRRLEMRCATMFKARLDNCRRLTMPPFCLRPMVILGLRCDVLKFKFVNVNHTALQELASAIGDAGLWRSARRSVFAVT